MTTPTPPEQQSEREARRLPWAGRRALPYWLEDVLGLALFVLALLTVWGLLPPGVPRDTWLFPWIRACRMLFGWGAWVVPFFLGHLSLLLFRHASGRTLHWRWGRWFAWEVFYFALLAGLSLARGADIARALAGYDGGLVGWALATALTALPALVAWTVLLAVLGGSLVFALGLPGHLIPVQAEKPATPPAPTSQPVPPVAPKPAAEPPKPSVRPQAHIAVKPGVSPNAEAIKPPGESPPRPDGLPPLDLLDDEESGVVDQTFVEEMGRRIEEALAEFEVPARVVGANIGPSVVQFAVEPGYVERMTPEGPKRQKVRVAQILSLRRDLALALAVKRLRIQAPVPGRPYIGIEVPNPHARVVRLKPLLASPEFRRLHRPLAIVLGRNTSGDVVVADLAAMPHLLVAGTTGSGKSIFLQALALTLVMNLSPEDLKLVLIDPKRVELNRFSDLPHLLGPVEVAPKRILAVLQWLVAEMQRRYRLFEKTRVRDLEAYRAKARRRDDLDPLPYIVVLIDELADLILHAAEQVEFALVRLAQLARATGIHLVVATQRPSVDVITGLIKANFPARIAFQVASSVDSRVILDQPGAETLLGRGDMLFLPPDAPAPIRVQGPYVSDREIRRVVRYWQEHAASEGYIAPWEGLTQEEQTARWDPLLEEAARIVIETQRANTSLLQRRLRIGYPRAARLMEQLERLGIVGPAEPGRRDRPVLIEPGTPVHLGDLSASPEDGD